MKSDRMENLERKDFIDTIKRTIIIMAVAVVFTRLLDFPYWITLLAVLLGLPVILHAVFWIRKLESPQKGEN